jgi:hypothetical protein
MGWLDPQHIDSYFVQEKKYRGIAVIAREEVAAIFYSYFFKPYLTTQNSLKKNRATYHSSINRRFRYKKRARIEIQPILKSNIL